MERTSRSGFVFFARIFDINADRSSGVSESMEMCLPQNTQCGRAATQFRISNIEQRMSNFEGHKSCRENKPKRRADNFAQHNRERSERFDRRIVVQSTQRGGGGAPGSSVVRHDPGAPMAISAG
jgi:hypothetical protein